MVDRKLATPVPPIGYARGLMQFASLARGIEARPC